MTKYLVFFFERTTVSLLALNDSERPKFR